MGKPIKGKPRMYDEALLLAAGVDRAILASAKILTGKRNRSTNIEDFKRVLNVVDEQDFINRYEWVNLPGGITGQELERMLYYKGQVCLFYHKDIKAFYFMPYALDGTIDFYGRYNTVHPIPFNEGGEREKEKTEALRKLLDSIKLKPQYDVLTEEKTEEEKASMCVLLHDYTKQFSQEITPRFMLQKPIINFEAEAFPMARTAMIAASGIKGMRVSGADEKEEVESANDQIYQAALSGALFIPIVSATEMQEFANKSATKSEDYLMQIQAIDNLRLSLHGIRNGGLFQKKAHKLEGEQDMNESPATLTYYDGLKIRQNFCTIANSIWGSGVWCREPAYMKNIDSPTPEEDGQSKDGESEEGGSIDA